MTCVHIEEEEYCAGGGNMYHKVVLELPLEQLSIHPFTVREPMEGPWYHTSSHLYLLVLSVKHNHGKDGLSTSTGTNQNDDL